ncbi:unnamed protein product [Closterium sp. NIES-54]
MGAGQAEQRSWSEYREGERGEGMVEGRGGREEQGEEECSEECNEESMALSEQHHQAQQAQEQAHAQQQQQAEAEAEAEGEQQRWAESAESLVLPAIASKLVLVAQVSGTHMGRRDTRRDPEAWGRAAR